MTNNTTTKPDTALPQQHSKPTNKQKNKTTTNPDTTHPLQHNKPTNKQNNKTTTKPDTTLPIQQSKLTNKQTDKQSNSTNVKPDTTLTQQHTNPPSSKDIRQTTRNRNPTQTHTPITTTTKDTELTIIQININGISNKHEELTLLAQNTKADIITVQETKLTDKNKTPHIQNYTSVRRDRNYNKGGGLLTYINNNISFSEAPIPQTINAHNTELQIIKLHLSPSKHIRIANIYIPPRDTTNPHHITEDRDITQCIQHITQLDNTIITGDINAHSLAWHCPANDHRGDIITDLITNSSHIVLNEDTPTRLPHAKNQQPTSPDISTVTSNLYPQTTWQTVQALTSDHLPIRITVNTKAKFRLVQHRQTYTNYNKADWNKFTQQIEDTISETAPTNNVHIANKILTNAILHADKHHIPKGKMHNNIQLLPEDIRNKIKHRDQIRKQDPHAVDLPALNNEITKLIQQHKTNLWKEKLDKHWDHKQNTHILWKTIHSLQNKKPQQSQNQTINFNNKTATTAKQTATLFNKQFVNVTKHSTNKTNRKTDRITKRLPKTQILITSPQVKQAIMDSTNNNSTGPDNINIKHLKHLGPKAIEFLTALYNNALNNNTIPHIWKLAKIVPIPKPQKDPGQGTSYRPISLLSPIAKTLEKVILPHITNNIDNNEHQHGFKAQHSTVTALHNINSVITEGFNQRKPAERTVMVSLDMSKAFDTVNIHTLIAKVQSTNTPPTIIKFVANYLKGRKAYTTYKHATSAQLKLKTGVPQGGVLSPTLFNIYMSDIPTPPEHVSLSTYADDITTLSSHVNTNTAQQNLQPYLNEIVTWTQNNDLQINPDKSTSILFTPDQAEYNTTLNLHINNTLIPTVKHPKVLGVTYDPKLNYAQHTDLTKNKASKTTNMLKALTSTNWGKHKETLITTFKAITRPILEYGSTTWSPIISNTNLNKLQTVQNTALRIATGCTADTNIQHLHDETQVLPLDIHLKLQASQLKQKAQLATHPLHKYTTQQQAARNMKQTIFHNNNYTTNINNASTDITEQDIQRNIKSIHTTVVANYLANRKHNKIINEPAPKINETEQTLPRGTRRTLAQLRTGKSPFLRTYKHKIDPLSQPTPTCPLCNIHEHTTQHLFTCTNIATHLTPRDLWMDPVGVAALLERWTDAIGRI
jgi:hypothetical protein